MMEAHVPADRLNDHVDGVLDPGAEAAVLTHLAGCPVCAAEAASLRALRADAGALPRSLDPGADLRPGIRAEIARRSAAAPGSDMAPRGALARRGDLATRPDRAARRRRHARTGRPLMAAAALSVIVAGATLTAVLLRTGGTRTETRAAAAAGEAASTVLALDRAYLRAAEDLRPAVDAATESLAPGTARLLRTNVAAVERALAESRAALLEDPGSPVLRELVLAAHRQRLDVLRQAAALAAEPEEAT